MKLASGEQFTSEYILLATGGKPDLPNIPGIDHVLTSDQIFSLSTLPQNLLIVGGGYIACEFASIFTGFGTKVTQFCRGETILRGFDSEATTLVANQMKSNGVDLQYGVNVVKITKQENSFRVADNYDRVQDFDQILFATGRVPNSYGLQHDSAGLSVGDNGEIIVNKYSKSSIDSIYAIGDLTNRKQLTPIAIKEAMAFVQTAFFNNPTCLDYSSIPTAIFTKPEMGTVGLSEEVAAERIFSAHRATESAKNIEESILTNRQRYLTMRQNFQRLYGVDIADPANFDLIIDTSQLTPEGILHQIDTHLLEQDSQ